MSPPPIPAPAQTLSPPRPTFSLDGAEVESDQPSASHSRTQSHTSAATSSVDSPPITPRSLTFGNTINPFSPPASVRSFSSPDHTPVASPGVPGPHAQVHYPFPDSTPRSGITSTATSTADLPRTSSYYGSRPNTAEYPLGASARPSSARLREAFTSPPARPLTMYGNSNPSQKIKRERPKSTMLSESNPLHKPWMESRDPYSRIAYWVTYGVMLLGVAAGVIRCYFGWISVPLITQPLCMVLDEDFSGGDNVFSESGTFFREVDMSGFGNGEFEMTTDSSNNSFVRNGQLYITPTLTSDIIGFDAINDGHVFNITDCTFNITQGWSYTASSSTIKSPQGINSTGIGTDVPFDAAGYYAACSAVSNSTAGTVINPVQSARLTTRKSASIRYGKVEVVAKIPTGDWLWPAIWMLPVNNVYGAWPLSGEIDIMEARGNGPKYPKQGSNYVRGSLNWGPATFLNAVAKTYGWWTSKRTSYDKGFHTYGLEWTDEFLRVYIDTRLHLMLDIRFNKPFFDRGNFPAVIENGTQTYVLQNPWANGTNASPFDESFYLILNVAVGGRNGWFPDGAGDKPWIDGSPTAMRQFALAQSEWYSTWPTNVEERSMVVDSVKMWQLC